MMKYVGRRGSSSKFEELGPNRKKQAISKTLGSLKGVPDELARQLNSRYQNLLKAEEGVKQGLWSSVAWRRLRLEKGQLTEIAVAVSTNTTAR